MSRIPRHPPNFEPSDGRYTFSVSLSSHLDSDYRPPSTPPPCHPPTTSTGLRVRWSSRIKIISGFRGVNSRPRDSDRFSN
jgi:hypothetical protein